MEEEVMKDKKIPAHCPKATTDWKEGLHNRAAIGLIA